MRENPVTSCRAFSRSWAWSMSRVASRREALKTGTCRRWRPSGSMCALGWLSGERAGDSPLRVACTDTLSGCPAWRRHCVMLAGVLPGTPGWRCSCMQSAKVSSANQSTRLRSSASLSRMCVIAATESSNNVDATADGASPGMLSAAVMSWGDWTRTSAGGVSEASWCARRFCSVVYRFVIAHRSWRVPLTACSRSIIGRARKTLRVCSYPPQSTQASADRRG